MSKAGGIAYLLKHGRAPYPTVTRTEMPRAKGVKRMADGGETTPTTNAPINAMLNYGTVPDYVFVPGGIATDERGRPVFKSGRYELRTKAEQGAAGSPTSSVGVPVVRDGGGSRAGYDPTAPENKWAGMTEQEKADYYNANPEMGKFTRMGIEALDKTLLGKAIGWLQDKFDPGFREANLAQTYGLGRDKFEAIAREMGVNGSNMATPSPNEGMSEAEQRAAYAEGRSYVPTGYAADGMGPPASAADSGARAAAEAAATQRSIDSRTSEADANAARAAGGNYGWAEGGSVPRMAAGGIGSLADQGGFIGSYAAGGRMLKGPGDGLSDHIPAVIGKGKPARLADGEFVVSADVVSALGGGSTEAGARKLYAMMDRIRKQAHGTKKQVKKVSEKKVLPA